jgi:hypothetical protein
MVGHEGEVMSVAPSPDGKFLLTTGRDQTIVCWSLEPWPEQRELGASFTTTTRGRLLVQKVDLGSPAWEAGLTDSDEVELVLIVDPDKPEGLIYDPLKRLSYDARTRIASGTFLQDGKKIPVRMIAREFADARTILTALKEVKPNRQHIFVWRHKGVEQSQFTTVRQRPLWRFFPTRASQGDEWVLWRWRDFYYDTNSTRADRLLGWHVNQESLRQTPLFYRLDEYRGLDQARSAEGRRIGRHNPDKVWTTILDAHNQPEKVHFADIEPPLIDLAVMQQPSVKGDAGKPRDLVVRASAHSKDSVRSQHVVRATLWVNDSVFADLDIDRKTGVVRADVTIPRDRLANGANVIRLTCFNAEGGRSERSLVVNYFDPHRKKPTLHAICIGIDDYSKVKNLDDEDPNLKCAVADALELYLVFKQHDNSGLFNNSRVVSVLQHNATKKRILAELDRVAQSASPDDWFVLFLSGHGTARETEKGYEPGSFRYICADSDLTRPTTLLHASELREVLGRIRARKLLLLDACHSGAVLSNPVKDINSNGARFLIFAACLPDQKAFEPNPRATGMKHGLFTQGLLTALGDARAGTDRPRTQIVTADELGTSVHKRIEELKRVLEDLAAKRREKLPDSARGQKPIFDPLPLLATPVLCRPGSTKK